MTQRNVKKMLANTLFVLAVLGTAVFGYIGGNGEVNAEGSSVEHAMHSGRLESDGLSR